MKRNIHGFEISWVGDARIEATRSTAPKHGYEFETSADRKHVKRLDLVAPVDVPKGDALIDAEQFEDEARKAAKEFVRLQNAA